jgi:16S rRNA (cytosine967-C5)-methyltransferase
MDSVSLRKTAVNYLHRILYQSAYLNILTSHIAESPKLTAQEKGYLIDVVTGVVVWRKKLEWIVSQYSSISIQKLEHRILLYLLIAIYELVESHSNPDYTIVYDTVESVKQERGKQTAGFINGVLRAVQNGKNTIQFPDIERNPVKNISIRYSHPEWMIERWTERYGINDTEYLCQWNNSKHPIVIRVNTLKPDKNRFIEYINKEYQTSASSINEFPNFLKFISPPGTLFHTAWFTNGYFSVQSIPSALAVMTLEPTEGNVIIDLCSAPGGKAAYIAELMGDKGRVIAVDINSNRLKLVRETAKRLGITCITTVCADGTVFDCPPADKVLLDAPCSGFGTLHQKADIRWKRPKKDIYELADIQYRLMQNASRLVKPGGVIVYSTCTIEPEENEEIIIKFLKNNYNFIEEQISLLSCLSITLSNNYVTLLPFKHNFDGSFIAKLQRIE